MIEKSFKDMLNEEELEEQRLDEAFLKATSFVTDFLRKNRAETRASINKLQLNTKPEFKQLLTKIAREIQTDEKGARKFVQDQARLRLGVSVVKV